jgi:Replicative DNA helicase
MQRTKGLVPTQTANKESASVNAGNVISFTANLSGQDKSDVQHSILLAQLGASGKYSRTDKPTDWYNSYFQILTNVGWIIQGDPFVPYTAKGSTVTIQEAVIGLLAAIASQNVVLIVKQALEALKELHQNDRGFVIWDRSTHSKKNGNFQISGARKDNTSIALNATNVYFTATQTDTKFLWFSYSRSEVSLFYRNNVLTLNQDVYSSVRNTIEQKLKNHVTDYVDNLPI